MTPDDIAFCILFIVLPVVTFFGFNVYWIFQDKDRWSDKFTFLKSYKEFKQNQIKKMTKVGKYFLWPLMAIPYYIFVIGYVLCYATIFGAISIKNIFYETHSN